MCMRCGFMILLAAMGVGCSNQGASRGRSFDQELQLTLRAGRGELTEAEKKVLLKENHPILAQVSDPTAFKLFGLFSRLPDGERQRMLEDSYVKWRMSELDEDAQDLCRQMIKLVVEMRAVGVSPFEMVTDLKARRVLLEQTEVGFAVVELDKSKQKVVSWFAFGPHLAMPLWVTIVNADASTSDEYVQAHMQRLPLLRSMKPSSPPRLFLHPSVITSMV